MTLGSIVNKVSQYIKATPYDINELTNQFLREIAGDIRIKTTVTIDISALGDPTEIDIPDDVLKVREVKIDDVKVDNASDTSDVGNVLTLYIDQEARKIVFSDSLDSSSDVLTLDVIKVSDSNTTVSVSADFDVPDIWLDSIVMYCVKELYMYDTYFNYDKHVVYSRRFDSVYRKMKRDKIPGRPRFNLGRTL